MTSRRALLIGTATVAVGGGLLAVSGRADDLARAIGLDPVPLPDPGDEQLVAAVAEDQRRLLGIVDGAGQDWAPVRDLLGEQLVAVGGDPTAPITRTTGDPAAALRAAADERAAQALEARSPALARVLASMSAGLDVLAEAGA